MQIPKNYANNLARIFVEIHYAKDPNKEFIKGDAVPSWLLTSEEMETMYYLQFVLQYASDLCRGAPPICTGNTFEKKYWGLGVPESS